MNHSDGITCPEIVREWAVTGEILVYNENKKGFRRRIEMLFDSTCLKIDAISAKNNCITDSDKYRIDADLRRIFSTALYMSFEYNENYIRRFFD